MIDLATIPVTDLSAIVLARGKVLLLAEHLGFGNVESTRLASVTSDLTRKLCAADIEGRVLIGLDQCEAGHCLNLRFQGAPLSLPQQLVRSVFDSVDCVSEEDGVSQLCARRRLPDPEFKPTEALVRHLRKILTSRSKSEMARAVRHKNLELETLNRRLSSSLTELVEKNADAILVITKQGRVAFANSAAVSFFGRPLEGTTGLDLDLPSSEDGETEVEIVVPGSDHGKFGAIRTAPVTWKSTSGSLVTIRDVTERKLQNHNNAQLAAIVGNSVDAIFALSSEGTILSWNAGAEQLFGYPADEIVGRSEKLLFAGGDGQNCGEALLTGSHLMRDAVGRRRDGSVIDVAIAIDPMRQFDGTLLGYSVVIRDISERKRVENHMRTVMRELSHRTKNQLAVIMAMVRLTASSTTDAAVLQSELIERMQGLAASHDLLVSDNWRGASLEDMVAAVLHPFLGSSPEALVCSGPRVIVNAVAVQNLGLALHELATNAAKYGALATPEGRVHVTWSFEPDEKGERLLTIDWLERNGPAVTQPTISGFGHVVLEQVAAEALSARVAYDFPRDGVHWSIVIPADFVVNVPSAAPTLTKACA